MALLEIEKLCAFYGKAQALSEVSLSVEEGSIIAIVGANGAGKSTLLDSIMGLTNTTGDILVGGSSIKNQSPSVIVNQGIGYAPERFNLFPYMSVRDNLLVGAHLARSHMEDNLKRVYNLFPRLFERVSQETATLSGGERQMVSLGRALMTNPRLLLIDEPTIGLAPKVCNDIAAALTRLNVETGLTILITEQNVNFATSLASQLHVLETGEIRLSGATEELISNPDLNAAYFGH